MTGLPAHCRSTFPKLLSVALTGLIALTPQSLLAQEDARPLIEYDRLLSFDLAVEEGLDDRGDERPRETEIEPLFRFSARIAPGRDWSGFFETEFLSQTTWVQGESRETRNVAKINQAYIRYDGAVDLRFGRFLYRDEREWLIDENFDGVLLGFDLGEVSVEALAGRVGLLRREPFNPDSLGERINHLAILAEIEPRDDMYLAAFAVFGEDLRREGGRHYSVGLRSYGALGPDFDYWANFGLSRGEVENRRQHGYGFDIGGTRHWKAHPVQPRLTLGYAMGSGDGDPDDSTDHAYRQTGLQSNEAQFGGFAKFKYYGEALDLDLSNIAILTAGVGLTAQDTVSLDVIYHRYHERESAEGNAQHFGDGLDLVVGFRPEGKFEIDAALGWFEPGSNPEAPQSGVVVRLEVEYAF